MTGLKVDTDLCVGCGLCVRTCANDGIEVSGRKARVKDGCICCGLCVDACPVGALEVVRDQAAAAPEASGFLVVCQTGEDGAPLPVAYELMGKGRALADERGATLCALVLAPPAPFGERGYDYGSLGRCGADEIAVMRDLRFTVPDTALMARTVEAMIEALQPEAVLFGATDLGRELAPQVAERKQCGLTADCTRLAMDPDTGLLLQTRPAFGGNLMATIACPSTRPQMATVRPGVFEAPAEDPTRAFTLRELCVPAEPGNGILVLSSEGASEGASITDADVLVVVGRGIRERKNIALAERLAELLGGALGCTRPIVEQGWLDHSHQVGQTGVSVAPQLLVSLGCSGAIQHLAGISGAKTVVAVNEDPDAPIFAAADYRVVGDCLEVTRALIERLEA